jgi:hypothetical protein
MVLIFAIHKWKKEDMKLVTQKVIEATRYIPEGISFKFAYVKTDLAGAWCIWEADNPKIVKNFLDEKVPEMETEVESVIQWFPPHMDLYTFMHRLISE